MSQFTHAIRTVCIIVPALLAGTAAAEQIYRSVDAEGNVTFSSEPPAGAVEVDEVKVQPGPTAAEQEAARERVQAQEATASELGEARASRTPPPPASQDAPAVVEPVERVNQYYGYPNRKPVRPVRPVRPDRPVQLPARPVPRQGE
jgi:hypothetical protein